MSPIRTNKQQQGNIGLLSFWSVRSWVSQFETDHHVDHFLTNTAWEIRLFKKKKSGPFHWSCSSTNIALREEASEWIHQPTSVKSSHWAKNDVQRGSLCNISDRLKLVLSRSLQLLCLHPPHKEKPAHLLEHTSRLRLDCPRQCSGEQITVIQKHLNEKCNTLKNII